MAASDVPTRVLPADGMDTNLQGRLRNTTLLPSNGMAPLYEAVSNSIHAIEDAAPSAGRIRIQITRDTQLPMAFEATDGSSGPKATRDITGFKIIDNGIGFNDANMDSFRTLDSEYKADRGGRGVGRLLWLKAFHSVHIDSVFFAASGTLTRRSFKFDAHHGISERTTVAASDSTRCTQVDLIGFSKRYRKASPKTARVIATNLLEHCLWYFVRPGTAPALTADCGTSSPFVDLPRRQTSAAPGGAADLGRRPRHLPAAPSEPIPRGYASSVSSSTGNTFATFATYSNLSLCTASMNLPLASAMAVKLVWNALDTPLAHALLFGLGRIISRYRNPQSSRFVCINATRRHWSRTAFKDKAHRR